MKLATRPDDPRSPQQPGALRAWLSRHRKVVALGLAFALCDLVVFALGAPLDFLDGKVWYTAETVYSVLAAQGEAGRAAYWRVEWLDLLVNVSLYTAFFWQALRAVGMRLPWPVLLMTGCDYVETAGLLRLLALYPERVEWLAEAVSWGSLGKWVMVGVIVAEFLRRLRVRERAAA